MLTRHLGGQHGAATTHPPTQTSQLQLQPRACSSASAPNINDTHIATNRRDNDRAWSWGKYRAAESDAITAAAAAAAAAALAAVSGVVVNGDNDDRRVLQESGPVPGGPIFGEGEEEDSFQRFPSSNRVHHAIKVRGGWRFASFCSGVGSSCC